MKITRLLLEGASHAPRTETQRVAGGLNVIRLDDHRQGAQLTDLLCTLLYGRSTSGRNAGTLSFSGEIEVDDPLGRFVLRRAISADGSPRLTVASLDARQPPSNVIQHLLQDLPVGVAESVFHANGRRGDQLSELLCESVAKAFHGLGKHSPSTADTTATPRWTEPTHSQDDLLAYRDQLAHRIEQALGDRRVRSGQIEQEIAEVDRELDRLATRREDADRQRTTLEAQLAGLESQLRYAAISETIHREADRAGRQDATPEIDELDQQIERWRSTLAELELRESQVRSELASVHPDDASPTVSLADHRAGLAVAARLLEDLEGEVARLARAADSQACVCRDAHPRINPLVETLARQIERLSALDDQQHRALRAQQLKAEVDHLSRSQADLQRQLDHLLTRRQEIYRSGRQKRDQQLVACSSDQLALDQQDRPELERRLHELEAELGEIAATSDRLESRRTALYQERSALLSSNDLDGLQAELHDVTRRLRDAPRRQAAAGPDRSNPWRASELLARLTDGQWVGLRLVSGGRELCATDRYGKQVLARELPSAERRLASLALRLSLAWTACRQGVRLPLVLDEPFAGLSPVQTATLTTVLDDYGRNGGQVFVATDDAHALDRFSSLGVVLLASEATAAPREFEIETRPPRQPVSASFTRTTRRASEYLLSPEDGIERFPVPIRNRESVFSRSRIRTIADLISADPSAVAEELDRDDVTAALVALWQTHLAYVCFVPHTTFDDAIALTGAGIDSLEELEELDAQTVAQRVEEYLRSDRGERLRQRGYRCSRDHANRLIENARTGRSRWRQSQAYRGWERHRGERRERVARNRSYRTNGGEGLRLRTETTEPRRRRKKSSTGRRSGETRSNGRSAGQQKVQKLQFHLETASPVVDAPSIGPKAAEKLKKVGIRTVHDLISADPEQLAEKLQGTRYDGETIVAWQHQAQLVCRIPGIRGHDAQVLVECGFSRPEEIASMQPAELFGFVEPFCQTEEGRRLLRNNRVPDLAEVTDWVNWSRQCRVLGAA